MFTLSLVETKPGQDRLLVNPGRTDVATIKLEDTIFEHFRHNFESIDPEKIQQVIAILLAPPKKRRSDFGKPKTRPVNGTQPELPTA